MPSCNADVVEILLEHIVTEVEQIDHSHLLNLINRLSDYIKGVVQPTQPQHLSKLEQANAIYDSLPGAERMQVIRVMMLQLDMSKAGASSYYSQARERQQCISVSSQVSKSSRQLTLTL